MKNTNLLSGTPGTVISTGEHIADAGALMESTGVPKDGGWFMVVNPFTQKALSTIQRSIGTVDALVSPAFREATIADRFAGMKVMTGTTLATYTTGSEADRTGTLSGAPDVTYLTAKDTMQQTLAVQDFGAGATEIKAGETIRISGRNRLNLSTRKTILDENGAAILFSGTVVSDVTLSGGAGNVVVSGPAIFETLGQYNTTSTAVMSGDVVTLLGGATTTIQPNLFWHKNAFTVASVPIKKLHSTDTLGTTEDGLAFRVSKGADFLKNEQKVRIDFRPAYGVLNPFFSGQAFG